MRLISSACCAPYLSHTGFTAAWNGPLSSILMISMPAASICLFDFSSMAYQSLRSSCCASLASLVVLRERAPGLLGEHQDFRDHQVPGERVVLGMSVVLAGGVGRSVVLGAVDDPGLHGVDELVHAHGDAVAAERIHGVDED